MDRKPESQPFNKIKYLQGAIEQAKKNPMGTEEYKALLEGIDESKGEVSPNKIKDFFNKIRGATIYAESFNDLKIISGVIKLEEIRPTNIPDKEIKDPNKDFLGYRIVATKDVDGSYKFYPFVAADHSKEK